METNDKTPSEKRSYKEFEADYIAFRDAKNNFIDKHGDVCEDVTIRPRKNPKNSFAIDIEIVTNSKVYDLYDFLN